MGKEILTFGNIDIEENKCYRYKSPIFIFKSPIVDIEKVLVSNKISFGKKTISTLLVTCKVIIKLRYYI